MTDADRAAHAAEIAAHRAARLRRLTAPDGWLALVERIPLPAGETAVDIGVLTVRGGAVRFAARPGLLVTCDGEPVTERTLRPDEPGPPDVLVWGARRYEVVCRGEHFWLRVRDPDSPARRAFPGLAFFPVRPEWRLEARFERYDPPRLLARQFDVGPGAPQLCPGAAVFESAGRAHALEPTVEGDRLFFLFGDATNADETYPAGRFLYTPLPAGERLVLDFNKAFNPPCAFTPFALCPRVPPEARLPFRIEAGEKRPPAPPAGEAPRDPP